MTVSSVQLQLGGQERTLKFNMGTLKFIGELTASDPLGFGADIATNMGKLFDYTKTIIHASLLSDYKSRKANVDFTADDVDDWVADLDTTTALELIGHYSKAFSASEGGDPNESKVKVLTKN